MSKVIQFPVQGVACEELGGCPRCHSYTTRRNIDAAHWMCCDKHKTCWYLGENLFSDWLLEPEGASVVNARLLRGYRTVEPWFPRRATA
jgi:uncharacterized CHY-type Zn-finger protein